MTKTFSIRFPAFSSDNRKSKTCTEPCRSIQNPKWVGIFAFALTFAMCGAVAQAQQAKKVPRIGYLSVLSPSSDSTRIEAFRQGLRELAYVEGQSISIESRYAEGKLNRLPDLAEELVRLKVDIIVVGGSTATRAAKNVTKLIPIVMAHGSDDKRARGRCTGVGSTTSTRGSSSAQRVGERFFGNDHGACRRFY